MSDDIFTSVDELIKESIKERAKNDIDADVDLAWEKYNNKYNSKPKSPSKWSVVACSLIIFLASGLWLMPKEGTALNLKIFETIRSFVAGKVQTAHISFGTQKKEKDLVDSLKPEVAQVLNDVPYQALLPTDLVGQYYIERVIAQKVGDSTKVVLFIKTASSAPVTISQINIIGDFNQATSYDTEDAVMKKM
ncbi:hypothetical protein [Desulforamulus hydrothermalis]|uniref:hypothetical protein n=1 Tax=Desulforamulus hydrothermalis TaxID=412895 RepID=UPI000913C648|nr:hypothetical protein [Desulforamulus hydrothermalis]SHH51893.1 hypothetical protein SAMN02745177_02725 [Desulforamulus hydrothermalis Lam5 = DSM 18033]